MVQPHIGGGKMHAAIIALMEILNRTFLPLTVQQVERPEKRLVNAHFRCVHIRAEGLFPFRTEKVSKLLLYQGLELLLRAAAQKDRAADAAEEQHPRQDGLERGVLHGKVRDRAAQRAKKAHQDPDARHFLIVPELFRKLGVAEFFSSCHFTSILYHGVFQISQLSIQFSPQSSAGSYGSSGIQPAG